VKSILVACEESQVVATAFREKGHSAYSCDILPTSGDNPEWHIQDDVLKHIDKGWSAIIAFPPCTHLAVSGAAWFEEKRKDGRQQKAIDFFMAIANADARFIAVENPISIMSTKWRKPDQYIQPYEFGHMEQKKTCLWLKNLPPLKPTNNVYCEMMQLPKRERERLHYLPPSPDRAKIRSKTCLGIAKAMAEQWSDIINEQPRGR
jgi:hypothetical protein